jgi:hypothetical protein
MPWSYSLTLGPQLIAEVSEDKPIKGGSKKAEQGKSKVDPKAQRWGGKADKDTEAAGYCYLSSLHAPCLLARSLDHLLVPDSSTPSLLARSLTHSLTHAHFLHVCAGSGSAR